MDQFLKDLEKEKQSRPGKFSYSYFNGKEKKFEDEFLFFVKQVPKHLMDFDWIKLAEVVMSDNTVDEDRGSKMSNFGFAGSNCCERVPHNCALASPAKHKGTVATFVKNSKLILYYFSEQTGVFMTEEDRSERFEKQIHPDNIIDAVSAVLTNLSGSMVKVHCDVQNDGSSKGMSAVFSVSKYMVIGGELYRLSLIAYKKQSIADFMPRFQFHRKFLERVSTEFQFMPEAEKKVDFSLLLPEDAVLPKRIPIWIDKTVYYSVYAYAIWRLFRQYVV